MSDFNDIGISCELDWRRVRKLMLIGIFGACGFHVPMCALAYQKLDDPSVKSMYRLLAKLGDNMMQLPIVRMEFAK